MDTTELARQCDNPSPVPSHGFTGEHSNMSASVLAFQSRATRAAGDAGLIALGAQLQDQLALFNQLGGEVDRAIALSEAHEPEWPPAACVRRGDRILLRGRFSNGDFTIGRSYSVDEIGRMGEWRASLCIYRPATGVPRSHKVVAWPRAQRRLDEICAAYRQWLEDCRVVENAIGLTATTDAYNVANENLIATIEAIASARATSPSGLAVKAQAVSYWHQPLADKSARETPETRLTRSLCQDAILIDELPPTPTTPTAYAGSR